jgi:hypothetical protein
MIGEELILCGLYIKGPMVFGTALERLGLGKIHRLSVSWLT